MAGGSVIGALRVVLGADTAALDKGLKDSRSALASFAKSVTTIASGIGLERAIESSVGALVGALKKGVVEADKLNKLSQSIGIPVDELSKLKYAADLSDVSLETLGKSAGKLSKAMVEVAGGGAGPAAEAFNALGVSVKNQDGTLRSSSEVLADIADKFASYKDGAAKTALAIAIFGKAGADMIPLLNMGRDGLKAAGDEAKELGLVLDKDTTQAAENFNDNLTRLGKVADGVVVQITARMLPSLEAFSGQMVQASKDASLLQMVADAITNSLKFVAAETALAVASFKRFGEEVTALWTSLKSIDWLNLGASLAKTWETVNVEGQKTAAVMSEVKKTVADMWNDVPTWESQALGIASMNKQVSLLGAEWTKAAAPIISSGEAAKNALQSFLDSQAKRTASQAAEAATVGKSVGEQAKLRIEYEAQAIALAKGIALTPALTAKITAAGNAAAAAAMKMQGANLVDQAAMPWDQRAQLIQQYTASMTLAGASSEQLALMTAKIQFPAFSSASIAATDFGMQIDNLATGAVESLSSNLAALITGTKSAAEAFKAFATSLIADLAAMIVKMLIFKAIRTAIFGFADGGMVGGTGFSLSGTGGLFASGGFVSGPGTGTSDSIPAMLSNGEFVVNAQATRQFAPLLNAINSGQLPAFKDGGDVSMSPSAVPAKSGGGNTVNLSVPIATTRDALRSIIDGLNDMFSDGYRLNVVPA